MPPEKIKLHLERKKPSALTWYGDKEFLEFMEKVIDAGKGK